MNSDTIAMAGRVLTRMGVALLILSIIVRPFIETDSALWADNLAIAASLAVIATGVLGNWLASRRSAEAPAVDDPD